ncbi:MAG TPA: response regulator [bacterium]|nr:response regulator [bacterium]
MVSTIDGTKTILVVEDNPDDEALTLRALKANGVSNDVVVARDGAEALDYLFGRDGEPSRGPSPLPQLVLLDLRLPKVDGLQVLRRIREEARTHCLPVVILTSSDEERDIIESYALGANSYVRKPVEFNEFMDGVRQLGLYWMIINRPPPAQVQ